MTSPSTPPDGLTDDGFLGGRLRILQPRTGYRAGIDPVLLAATVPARDGDTVLDLGCGVGTAALCLAARVPGVSIEGLERQRDYADLARENARRNGIGFRVHDGDLQRPPATLKERSFDHVIANPPYHLSGHRTGAADAGRESALAEDTPLAAWCDAAIRRLKNGGRLTMIQSAARLTDLLAGLDSRVGGIVVCPVAPRPGKDATRIVLTARKGARAAFRLSAPVILHEGARHEADGESYTPAIRAVLRDGASLALPGA